MSKQSHTPGPWTITKLDRGPACAVYAINNDEQEQHVVETTSGYDDISKANAHLIAAAPELLEALDKLGQSCANEWGPRFRESTVGKRAIDAIAKARGES